MSDSLSSCPRCFIPGKRAARYPLNWRRLCGPGPIWEISETMIMAMMMMNIIIIIIIVFCPCRESIHERYRARTLIIWSSFNEEFGKCWHNVTRSVCYLLLVFFKSFGQAMRIYFCKCFEKDKTRVQGVSVTKHVLYFPPVFFFFEMCFIATSF